MDVPGSKRKRLSNACNQCRKRKVRCDEGQPSCRNCLERHEECITTNPRTQDVVAIRKRTNNKASASFPLSSVVTVNKTGHGLPAESPYDSPEEQSRPSPLVATDLNGNHIHTLQYKTPPSTSSTTLSPPYYLPSKVNLTPKVTHISHNNYSDAAQQCSYDQETIINTAAPQKRKFIGGGTLQALSKYLDRCFERRGFETVGSKFVYGMQHAEEFPLPKLGSSPSLPVIPSRSERTTYLQAFFDRIYPMFPVLDISSFTSSLERLATQDLTMLQQDEIPDLACAYAVFALGADESAGNYTDIGSIYLSAAFNLWTYIMSIPYLVSVQALLLLTIAMKARNKDGCGAQSLGQAIRIAQSLGLHHARVERKATIPGNKPPEDNSDLDARIWWGCYCLEQQFGLEIGRPVAIRDSICNQVTPRSPASGTDFFGLWIGLAQIQSRLYEILYVRPLEARNASDLLRDIGRIDRELCDWAANVEPEEVRPSLDLLCSPKELHLATFLATSYFETLINVHQAALLLDSQTYKAIVEQHCFNSPMKPRLRSSEVILINSARKIADLQICLINQRTHSGMFMSTGIMMAMMVLGFHIMKDAKEKRNRADLELLTVLSRHAETQYSASGQHPKFIEAITTIQQQIQQEVYSRDMNQNSVAATPIQRLQPGTNGFSDSSMMADPLGEWGYGALGQMDNWNGLFGLGDCALADPWRWLQSDATGGIDNLMSS